ncbi:SRPBCC family protein [Salipiger bermudensis]|uniref:SRPBCC family protein n=1 Tax=Salipiger bermudensis TaxID=344736 RepID=UPI001C99F90D|nr:SRPBCC family protein [Salipiger bermudensis]MBY6004472.1 SRPBCC family protein [Salipiger bermudensis]
MTKAILLAAACALPVAALADTGITATYEASPEALWQTVEFHQPSETIMPPVASSERQGDGLGATKVNRLAQGGEAHLLLAWYDPEGHGFNYVIQSSPLPVKNYVGEVRVRDAGDGMAVLSWQGSFEADGVSEEEADAILRGFYEAIAQGVGQHHRLVSME